MQDSRESLLLPIYFNVLDRFTIVYHDHTEEEGPRVTVELVVKPPHGEADRLHVSFEGVTQLVVSQEPMWSFLNVRVTSTRESQWQESRYHVVEEEHSCFSFYCSDYTAVIKGPDTVS